MIKRCPEYLRSRRPDILVEYKGEIVPLIDMLYDWWSDYYDSPEGQKALEELKKAYDSPT